jgi:phosphoglycerol geranylgeranyltransferase
MTTTIESKISNELSKHKHLLFALIDSQNTREIEITINKIQSCGVDAILVGGSTIADQIQLDKTVQRIKRQTRLPVILFPGNITGISRHADAIFFSSLLNSEDPYFLIGAQAIGAYTVRKYKLEAIPMGYIIAGEGVTAGFIGRARPFPQNKPELIAAYALAASYLGMRFLYLEAGSGAAQIVPSNVITTVRSVYPGTLIVGGGIKSSEAAKTVIQSGADIIVVGNLIEERHFETTLKAISKTVHDTRN